LNSFTFADNSGLHGTLCFGGHGRFIKDISMFNLPPRPPAGAFDVRYSDDRMIWIPDGASESTARVILTDTEYPLGLSWNLIDQVSGYRIAIGGNDGQISEISGMGNLTIYDPLWNGCPHL